MLLTSWTSASCGLDHGRRIWYYETVSISNSRRLNPQTIADNLNLKEFAKRNIKLGYTPDVLTDAGKLLSIIIRSDIAKLNRCTVADVSVMLAFMASRNVRETMAIVHEGKVILLPSWH